MTRELKVFGKNLKKYMREVREVRHFKHPRCITRACWSKCLARSATLYQQRSLFRLIALRQHVQL